MKKLLIIALFLISATTFGQLQLVKVGAKPNDNTGDPLRTAFQKVNFAITQINTNTAGLLLRVPYTGATANLNLGINDFLLTGSIGATGSRVTKGWFTNLEITNLPTINGALLVNTLPFSSYVPYTGASGTVALGVNGITSTGTFSTTGARIAKIWTTNIESTNYPTVGGNALNTLLMPISDSVNYLKGYMSRYDGVIGLALKLNLADSVNYPNSYMSRFDGVSGLALKLNISDTANMLTNYLRNADIAGKLNISDTASMLSKYGRLAGAVFTSITIPSPFTLGSTSVTSSGDELNVLDGIPGTLTATELGYSDGVTSSIQQQLNDTILIETFTPLLADSNIVSPNGYITLNYLNDTLANYTGGGGGGSSNTVFVQLSDTVPLFEFGGGGGNNSDTVFIVTTSVYGAFYNKSSDTLKITELRANMIAGATPLGTDTLAIQVYWNDTLNVALGNSYTKLNTADLGINSTTTGTVDASFNNDEIPPSVWVWCKTPGVVLGRKPNMFTATLSGYKLPKYIDRFSNVRMLDDTLCLATFGAGGGNNNDTASFTTSTYYGAFFNKGSDTLNVIELRAVMVAGSTPLGTDTLDINVYWHATLGSGSATKLNTTDLPINSTTTGTTDTSFNNAKIPPNVWVWAKSPAVILGRKPNMLTIQISGYKTPKY